VQAEQTRVALRLRTPWEAVDLGVSMVRAWWLPIMASWLALFVPATLAVTLLSPSPIVAMLVLWWLKPAFDRVVLHVLSHGVFGPLPRWADTLSALPSLALRSGLVLSLLPLRFSPQRSLTLPILQLEQLRGRAYTSRARTLSGRDVATAIGFTAICSALELVLIAGAAALSSNVVADPLGNDALNLLSWSALAETPAWWIPLYAFAITLVEPFYVGGGFGLYLNRRIELEGWDIEVAFRAIARRHPRSVVQGAARALGVVVLLGCVALDARADETAPAPIQCDSDPAAARACVERVLGGPDFDRTQRVEGWRPRSWLRDLFRTAPEVAESDPSGVGAFLARVFSVLAWTVLIVGGLAALGGFVRFWMLRRPEQLEPDADPERLTGEIHAELPADVVGAALARWAADPAAALALLYAGARAHLIDRLSIVLPDGATERECERIARRHAGGALAEDFGSLTRAWVYCAYAHRLPSAGDFRTLCERWRGHLTVSA
jgi:hypothetical protein